MRYVVRLLVIPALMAFCVHWILMPGLDFPGYMEHDGAAGFVIFSTIAITFFTQLHRLDVSTRLERLEQRVEQLERRGEK